MRLPKHLQHPTNSKNPNPYEFVGNYYFDQLNKLVDEIKTLTAKQDDKTITEEQIKDIVEQIKAKVGLANGVSERAMDAFARYALVPSPSIRRR